MQILKNSSIHLDGGGIRKPDGSFAYKLGEVVYPPPVIGVLVSQKDKKLRKKVDLYFRASDVNTVVAVTIGGPSPEKSQESIEEKSYQGPNLSAQDHERSRIGTRSTPSASIGESS